MRHLLLFWLLFISVAGFGQKQQLILQVGHTMPITGLEKSADHRYLLSESHREVKIWEIESGKLIKTINDCIGISEDLELYATTYSGKIIVKNFYDLPTDTLQGHSGEVNKLRFSPDHKFAISISCDSTVKLSDLASRNIAISFPLVTHFYSDVKFSYDGKHALVDGRDSFIVVDLSSGRVAYKMRGRNPIFNPTSSQLAYIASDTTYLTMNYLHKNESSYCYDNPDKIVSINFDKFGRRLVSLTSEAKVVVRDVLQNKTVCVFICSNKDSEVACVNWQNWLKWYESCSETNHPDRERAEGACFSSDGKSIIVSRFGVDFNWKLAPLALYNATDGVLEHSFCSDRSKFDFYSTTSDLVLPNKNNEIVFYKKNGDVLKIIGHEAASIHGSDFDTKGPHALTPMDDFAYFWDITAGKIIYTFNEQSISVVSHILGRNRKIVNFSSTGDLRLYDIASSKNESIPYPTDQDVIWVKVAPDEKSIIFWGLDSKMKVVDLESKNIVATLHSDRQYNCVVFSKDNNKCALLRSDSIFIYDPKNWVLSDSFKFVGFDEHRIGLLSLSADGEVCLFSSYHSDTLLGFDLTKKKFLYEIPIENVLSSTVRHTQQQIIVGSYDRKPNSKAYDFKTGKLLYEVEGVVIDIDGNNIVTDNGNEILFWDLEQKQLARKVPKKTGESVLDINIKEDVFLTEMDNSWLHVNSLQTGNRLYSIIFIDSTNYLVMDPEGRFDGTEAAKKMLYYVCGKEVIELEQLKDLCWEPDLVAKIMGVNKEPINAKKLSEIEICGVIPQIEEKGIRDGNYEFEITPQNGGVGEVLLFVNEKRVKSYKANELVKQPNGYLLRIHKVEMETYFVPGFSNRISVKANTADGTKSSRGIVVEQEATGEAKSPHLYLLCIGVNKYKDEQLRLTYAAKDAQDFQKVVAASAKKLFNIDDDEHIHPYVLLAADGSMTWAGKADIQKAFEDIAAKATPSDILLLFMAGHGVMTGENKQFYFLTAEATKMGIEGIEKEVAISSNELDEWMRNIKAQKQLLVMDACNSGKGQSELEKLYAARSIKSDQTRALERLKDRTGIFILAASAENQAAYEGGLYEQGFLTHSLLHTIKDGSAIRDNKFIDVNKWFNQSADFAEKLAESQGNKQTPRLVGHASFDIGMVDDSLLAQINLGDKKQFFARSNFQNDDTFEDDLGFGNAVDNELKQTSSRGSEPSNIVLSEASRKEFYKIGGRYSIKADIITVNAKLVKDGVLLKEITQSGAKAEIGNLAVKIVGLIKNELR